MTAATTPMATMVTAPNGLMPYVIPANVPAAYRFARDPLSRQHNSACSARMTNGTAARSLFPVVADHATTGDANKTVAASTPAAVERNHARVNATSANTVATAPAQAMSFAPIMPNSAHANAYSVSW